MVKNVSYTEGRLPKGDFPSLSPFYHSKKDKRGWDERDRDASPREWDASLPFYPLVSLKIWRVEFIEKKG